MTALTVFNYANTQVRTVVLDGAPWFVAADVCAVLAIANGRDAINSLDEDEKGVATTDTPGGPQRMATINEPGLYSLILRSRKPEAKAFKRWVTHEVLPAIRKTGRYEVEPAVPRSFADALQLAADQQRQIEAQAAQLAIAAPKVAYVDTFTDVEDDATTIRMLATQLRITEPKLRAFLIDRAVLSRRTVYDYVDRDGKRKTEYEWQARAGFYTWFVAKDQPEAPRMYNGQLRSTLYVTPLGKAGIAGLLDKHRAGAA